MAIGSDCDFGVTGGKVETDFKANTCYGFEYTRAGNTADLDISGTDARPVLEISKVPDPFPARENSASTWTVTVTNSGDAPTWRLKIIDEMPPYVTYVSHSVSPDTTALNWVSSSPLSPGDTHGQTLVWVTDTPLNPGDSMVITLVGAIDCEGTPRATGNDAIAQTGCPNVQDTTAFKCISQEVEDIASPYWIVGNVTADSFSVIQTIPNYGYCDSEPWVIEFGNYDGVCAHSPITLTNILPANLFYISSTVEHSQAGSVTPDTDPNIYDTGTLSWILPDSGTTYYLNPGETITLTMYVGSTCDFNAATVTNKVEFKGYTCYGSQFRLPVSGYYQKTFNGINSLPSLSVVKSSKDTSYFAAEDTVDWTITITNNGATTTSRVIVYDTLPGYIEYQGATPAPDSAPAIGDTAGVLIWYLDCIGIFIFCHRGHRELRGKSDVFS